MTIKIRDLREVGFTLEAEEGLFISEAMTIEAILGTFKGQGPDLIGHHAFAGFEVGEEGAETFPFRDAEPAFVYWEAGLNLALWVGGRGWLGRSWHDE